jgi:hypothetical protein
MNEAGQKSAAHAEVDLARLEQTLLASIKLMKRGRREMERMRRKSGRHEHADGSGPAA